MEEAKRPIITQAGVQDSGRMEPAILPLDKTPTTDHQIVTQTFVTYFYQQTLKIIRIWRLSNKTL